MSAIRRAARPRRCIRRWLPAAAIAIAALACRSDPSGRVADSPSADDPSEAARPHIVLILADDLGYGDPRSWNPDSEIPTPAFDRLAAEGIRLTDAHTPSAVCSPTRYGLLTGRYAWRTRLRSGVLWGNSRALIEPGRTTIPSLLRDRGYATAGIGKWHLGLGDTEPVDYGAPLRPGPLEAGFDTYFGIPASLDMPPYLFLDNDRVARESTGWIGGSDPRRDGGEGFWRAGAIAPGFRHAEVLPTLTARAVRVIERHAERQPERPLFLYLALTAPHTPWLPGEGFRGGSGAGPYGDFVMQVDASVGEVLAALDRTGMTDETLVIATSDNGAHWLPRDIERWGHRANGALRGQKADIWEGGHRVPFVARWPGFVPAGSVSGETVCLTDLLATVASLLGTTLPDDAGEDSFDILPVLLGRAAEHGERAVVHHSLDGMFAIRQGRWKLVLGLGSGGFTPPAWIDPAPDGPSGQLYDLVSDPGEEHDLYRERPEVVARLSSLLDRYRREGRSRPENR
jgi:arylsulfatase A-like enzyme